MGSNFLVQFGRAVRKLREQHNLTQAELATRVGLSRTSVTNLESGRQNPSLTLLPELALALGVDVRVLVGLTVDEAGRTQTHLAAGQIKDVKIRRWVDQIITDPAAQELALGREPTRGEK